MKKESFFPKQHSSHDGCFGSVPYPATMSAVQQFSGTYGSYVLNAGSGGLGYNNSSFDSRTKMWDVMRKVRRWLCMYIRGTMN